MNKLWTVCTYVVGQLDNSMYLVELPHYSGDNGVRVLSTYGVGHQPPYNCLHCPCMSDTVEHTLLHQSKTDLREHFDHPSEVIGLPKILYGPIFKDLPANYLERGLA